MTRTVAVSLPAGGAAATDTSAPQAEDSRLAAALSGPDRIWTLLTFFGFGLLLAFTPCVFPMVPILSGIIAGAGNISTRRAFVLSLVYVLATAVVFTIAGVVAGLAGANLQIVFQTPWILVSFALLFVVLSFSMFGFYELQLPSRLQTRLTELSNKQSGGSLFGVAIMGVLSALIVGPCVAPPLAAAVLYISQTRDPILGGLALFSLALGMGAPLLAFGTAAGRILPRAGAWMDAVKAVFGVLFLGLAIWMLDRIVDPAVTLALSGSLLIGSAIYLGALEPVALAASGWKRLWKAIGVLLLLIGSAQMLGALAGGRDLMQPLKGVFGGAAPAAAELHFTTIKSSADLDRAIAAANAAGQPVMFDFYADWCVSCKEMEKYTFTDPAVHQALRGYVLLKADVTANDDIDQELMRRFGIIGPPGTLFFGLDGIEQRHLRLIGFEKAAPFVQRIQKATR
jgi:thiol:disulfide interchange protein DsbD